MTIYLGNFIAGFMATFNGLISPIVVEAIALKEVLCWLQSGNYSNVMLEMDAQAVVCKVLQG